MPKPSSSRQDAASMKPASAGEDSRFASTARGESERPAMDGRAAVLNANAVAPWTAGMDVLEAVGKRSGAQVGACFLLATFLCTSKEKYARPTGRNTPIQNQPLLAWREPAAEPGGVRPSVETTKSSEAASRCHGSP
jgi:hypothetical protein